VTGGPGPGGQEAARAVRRWLEEADVPGEAGARDGELVVRLPGETRNGTTVSLLVGDRWLTVAAFVVRRPDENHEEFYRYLLSRNLRLPGAAFALDRIGDVYLTARLPVAAVTVEAVDDLMGVICSTADSAFNDLLSLGFGTAIRAEWEWRLERGEPTANLEAFGHLRRD
jgi:hypothetical protein